jgi:hypothetical protein
MDTGQLTIPSHRRACRARGCTSIDIPSIDIPSIDIPSIDILSVVDTRQFTVSVDRLS